MKILIVSHMFPSYKFPVERSGVFVWNIAEALRNNGHDVEVISPVADPGILKRVRKDLDWYKYSEHLPKEDKYSDLDVKYPRYFSPNIAWRLFFSNLGRLMAKGIEKTFIVSINSFRPDIVHCHTLMPDTDAVLSLKNKYNLDIPVIGTVHGGEITYPLGIETLSDRPEKSNYFLYMRRMKKTIKKTDGIITVSDKLRYLLEHYWNGNYKTIYNGIPEQWLDNDRQMINKKMEIVTVGALIERKRIDFLADVFSEISGLHPEWKLRIIGEGLQRKFIENQFSELIDKGKIILMGNIANKEVRDYMRKASIFALPSVREPFGVVFIEAMASHLPVIGCSDGGPSEIIDDHENGFLIEPDNKTALKESLTALMEDRKKREKMSENAHNKAQRKFSWSVIADQTLDFYRQFL